LYLCEDRFGICRCGTDLREFQMINSPVDAPSKLAADAPKTDAPIVAPVVQPKPAPAPEKGSAMAPAPQKVAK